MSKRRYDESSDGNMTIKRNSLWLGGSLPHVKNVQKGEGMIVKYKEFITDINSSGTSTNGVSNFQLQNFTIQPGLLETFPWLSQLAANFQQYEFEGMVFEFRSLQADSVVNANNSSAYGEVIMATNYNSAAPNFPNKQQMLESEYVTNCKPSCNQLHPIELKPQLNVDTHLYIRTGGVPTNQDQRLYDIANFQIATQGLQAVNSLVGELWVHYHIVFYKPISGGTASGNNIPTDKFQSTNPTGLLPLGSTQNQTLNQLGGTITSSNGSIYSFPSNVVQGVYLVNFVVEGNSVTPVSYIPPLVTVRNGTILQVLSSGTGFDKSTFVFNPAAATFTTSFSLTFLMQVTSSNATIQFSPNGTFPNTPSFGDLIVTEVNANLSS